MIQKLLQACHLIEIFFTWVGHHQMRNLMIALQVFSLLRNPFCNEIINGTRHVTRRVLLQTGNNQILFVNNTAVIQALFTVEDFHQRGFTRAVTAYKTDAFVVFNMQFSIIEKWRIAKREPRAVHAN